MTAAPEAEPDSSRPKADRDILSFPFVVRGGSNGYGELPMLRLSPPSFIMRRKGVNLCKGYEAGSGRAAKRGWPIVSRPSIESAAADERMGHPHG